MVLTHLTSTSGVACFNGVLSHANIDIKDDTIILKKGTVSTSNRKAESKLWQRGYRHKNLQFFYVLVFGLIVFQLELIMGCVYDSSA